MKTPFGRIVIVGVGLIGGSLGMASRRAFPEARMIGIDRSRRVLKIARKIGAIDEAAPNAKKAIATADLVILALPVREILNWLTRNTTSLTPGTLVTDVGSTKRAIMATAQQLPASVYFIGGHPMAGKAQSGLTQARGDLFRGARYVLCPRALTPQHPLRRLRRWIRGLGGQPTIMDAETHDRLTAYISHLPQLLATALANLMAHFPQAGSQDLLIRLSAGGFRDMIRLASSSYTLWGDIADTNRDDLLQAIDEYEDILKEIKSSIRHGRLRSFFTQANQFHRRFTRIKKGIS